MKRSTTGTASRPGGPRIRGELIAIAALIVIALGLGTLLFVQSRNSGQEAPATVTGESAEDFDDIGPLGDIARRTAGDPLARGDVDAPVTLVMFSDYRCPFCAQFSRDTEKVLIERYVDSGQLRIEWRDLPIFGEQSMTSARAGRAAAEQGKFWEFTSAIYEDSPQRSHPDLTPEKLHGYAQQVGIADLERFDSESASNQHDQAINADATEGQTLGVSSTPTFSLNGYPIVGAQPTTKFTKSIDQLLENPK